VTQVTAESSRFDIFIAGDVDQAKQFCREYCMAIGLCVTVEPIAYIYTGGEEAGVRVGLINYPRFPSAPGVLETTALDLAHKLRVKLRQHSFTVVWPKESHWFSAREDAK